MKMRRSLYRTRTKHAVRRGERRARRDDPSTIDIEVSRHEGEVGTIAYRVRGIDDPKAQLSWEDKQHLYREIIDHLERIGDREAARLLSRRGSALPLGYSKDGWVILFD